MNTSHQTATRSGDRDRSAWVVMAPGVLLVAAVLLCYLPTPGDYWIRYDNEGLIRNTPRVRALALSGAQRTDALVTMFTTAHHDLYQPLLTLSLAIDYALFEWDRGGFHLHSLALHSFVVLALYLLIYRLTRSVAASLPAAMIVAVHPVMVQAVSWIICRTFLLTGAWILIGSHLYLFYAKDPRRFPYFVLAILAFTVSMTAKLLPGVVILPVVFDLWAGRKITLRACLDKVPLLGIGLFFTFLNMHFTGLAADQASVIRPWSEVLADTPVALVLTAANTIVPKDLALFYFGQQAWNVVGLRWVAVALAAAAGGALGVFLWRRGHRGLLLAGIAWLALVGPSVAAGKYRETVAADRYAYVPTFFLGLGLGAVFLVIWRRAEAARRSAAVYACWVVALMPVAPLAIQTRAESRKWADEARLWQTVIRLTPHPTAYGALGNVYRERNNWPEAVAAYEKAVPLAEADPYARNNPIYHGNLSQYARKAAAEILKDPSVPDRQARSARYAALARESAEEGIRRWPNHARMHYYLGRACIAQKDYEAAATAFASAARLNAQGYEALTYLARVQLQLGQTEKAIGNLQRALQITKKYPPTIRTLAQAYDQLEMHADAAAMYFNLANLNPADTAAHQGFFLAAFKTAQKKGYEKSEILLKRYLGRFGRLPQALQAKRMLGLLYAQQGKYQEAKGWLEEALRADPNDAQLRSALQRVNQRMATPPEADE